MEIARGYNNKPSDTSERNVTVKAAIFRLATWPQRHIYNVKDCTIESKSHKKMVRWDATWTGRSHAFGGEKYS